MSPVLISAVLALVVLCNAGCGANAPRAAPAAERRVPPAPAPAPAVTPTRAPSVGRVATVVSPAPATTPAKVATCPANLAAQLSRTESASQLITVDAPASSATSATLTAWQRSGRCWLRAGGPWNARLGYKGVSDHHTEGDGTTPSGAYGIGSEMYGNGPDPGVWYGYRRLACGDWWDEDPNSPLYNTFQHVTCGTNPPFGGSSEALWTLTTAYRSFAVIDYNMAPTRPFGGSAVFLHDDVGGPTNGCVSLAAPSLTTLLRWLQPAASPLIVIGTDAEIRRF
jgi:L,D-peptidoglycan transpeptidase YkuD (ErfK/YbiS/YcfS/YnhG family)